MKREKSLKATIMGHWTCTAAVVISMCLSLGFASTTKAYQIIQSIDSKSVGDDINRLRLSKEIFRGERVVILPFQVRIERSLAEFNDPFIFDQGGRLGANLFIPIQEFNPKHDIGKIRGRLKEMKDAATVARCLEPCLPWWWTWVVWG